MMERQMRNGEPGVEQRALGVPLVRTTRGQWVENVHCGHAAIVNADGQTVCKAGNAEVWTFMRSTAKPFQAVPAVAGGMLEAFGLGDEELALMCASHQGEARHIEVLERMLKRTGVDEEALVFRETLPSGSEARSELLRRGGRPRKLYHVCAGKHIGMLAYCRLRGWPLASYTQPDHPLQTELRRVVAVFAGLSEEQIGRAVDGCGLPVFALPLRALALMYARLAAPPADWADAELRVAAARIAAAMSRHPLLVEGSGRLASVMLADGGAIAKSGAQGMFAFALRGGRIACALKLSDGGESAWPEAVCAALEQIGGAEELIAAIRGELPPQIVNDAGQPVGRREPAASFICGSVH